MPNAYAQRLRLRLFLEGIEVPIIAANVQAAPNSPMVATVQIPPLAEATRFLPRTLVHLFFLDLYASASPFITEVGAGVERSAKRNPTAYERALQQRDKNLEGVDNDEFANQVNETMSNGFADTNNEEYKLLFGGEVVGFQWTKNQAQRSVVLQCVDWSNYWDYAFQWNNTDIFGPGIKAVFSGGATNLFTDFLSTKSEALTNLLLSGRCSSFPKLKGLAAGIIRLVEGIGGMYYPKPPEDPKKTVKKFAGQNKFFSLSELRLHISHMLAAFENDPTSSRLLSRHGYGGMFSRLLGSQGGQTSLRQAINALSGVIFHETFPQPCPFYKPGLEGSVSGQVRTKLRNDPKYGFLASAAEFIEAVLTDYLNTLTENEGLSENALFKASRTQFIKFMRERVAGTRKTLLQSLTKARGAPETAISAFTQAAQLLGQVNKLLLKWSPKAAPSLLQSIKDKLTRAREQMTRVKDLTINTTPPKSREPARLNQHVFRPDIWFGAPPRCNVLFPEDYRTLMYQRMFLQEPTRFLLKTNDEFFGEDELFDKFYFAPAVGGVSTNKANLQSVLRNELLDHELFTGILPVFEKMGEFNVYAARSGAQKEPTSKVGFAQRSVNFLYFKHRFNSRQMRVDGKFNPYIAVGFPGLIIDKYVDRETIERYNELRESAGLPVLKATQILGTNFLGSFTMVAHTVSQSGPDGKTEITCSYPRQPEESVEFLGSVEKVQTVRKRVDKDAIRATDIAAIQPPKLFSLGPNGGQITGITDVTNRYTSRQSGEVHQVENLSTAGQRLPIFQRGFSPGKQPVLVPVGVPVTPLEDVFPPDKLIEFLGGVDKQAVFSAFRVVEEIPRYRREEVDLPAEEFIRPGWYGDIWTNGKIGRVYEDFFGIGAITDGQTITDPSGATTGVHDDAAEDAAAEAQQAESSDDPRAEAPIIHELEQGATIQHAVEFLVLTYSYIKQNKLDVDEFIRAYTWRSIASMIDMFGTSDLAFTPTGEEVTQGFEGFHSRAFGAYDNVFGLVGGDLEDLVGIKRGSTSAQRADPRKRRYEAVQQYVSALRFSRAILG
jgi:hypothetical protein